MCSNTRKKVLWKRNTIVMKNFWLDRIRKEKKTEGEYYRVVRSGGRNIHYFDVSHLSGKQIDEFLKRMRQAFGNRSTNEKKVQN